MQYDAIAQSEHQIPGMMLRQFVLQNLPAVITLRFGWVSPSTVEC